MELFIEEVIREALFELTLSELYICSLPRVRVKNLFEPFFIFPPL